MKNSRRHFLAAAPFAAAALPAAANQEANIEDAGAKTSSLFNVKDFGAKGDGKTSDSAAIQKALDEAGKVQGTAYFPSGRYLCSNLKAKEHTTLLAEPQWGYSGEKGSLLVLESEEADCLLDITGAFGVHIKGLSLIGIRGAKKQIHGIMLNNEKDFSPKEDSLVIDDTQVMNFSGFGVFLNRAWLFIIRHSYIRSNNMGGIFLYGYDGFVLDNQISANGNHAMELAKYSGSMMFTANRVEWNRGCGFYGKNDGSINLTGNCFDCNWGPAIDLRESNNCTISSNVFRRCGRSDSVGGDDMSCQANLEGCSGIAMSCNSSGAGKMDRGKGDIRPKYGLKIKNLAYSVIDSNTFFNGFTDTMIVDGGSHGKDMFLTANTGKPLK